MNIQKNILNFQEILPAKPWNHQGNHIEQIPYGDEALNNMGSADRLDHFKARSII